MMNLYYWSKLTKEEKKRVLSRPMLDENEDIKEKIKNIIEQVRFGGDESLVKLTEKYDRVKLGRLQVTKSEFENAFNLVSEDAIDTIKFAKKQIETFHQFQFPKNKMSQTCEGVVCERQSRSIESIGLYIPGGSAPLVSTVLMLAIPAKIANCPLRILSTPPNQNGDINPHLLVAAELCGIQNIYKIGGAQAIGAMAYGTETIPKVDKIFGPGNTWVTQAKILVSQDPNGAAIDMPAGPSELIVIADHEANHEYVAADLLSQAEHGVDSQVILITTSEQLALRVANAIKRELENLPRKNIVKQSLSHSRFILVDSMEQAITVSNFYAPEHLILQVAEPDKFVTEIKNAGAVFLGPWSPETVGDYVTGSNHVLPTYGFARTFSGLSTVDFMKFIHFQTVTRKGLEKIGPYAEKMAEIEGLHGHKQAIALRLTKAEILYE